jgi:hypothetical protein
MPPTRRRHISHRIACTFSGCNRTFKNTTGLTQHIRGVHNVKFPNAHENILSSPNQSNDASSISDFNILSFPASSPLHNPLASQPMDDGTGAYSDPSNNVPHDSLSGPPSLASAEETEIYNVSPTSNGIPEIAPQSSPYRRPYVEEVEDEDMYRSSPWPPRNQSSPYRRPYVEEVEDEDMYCSSPRPPRRQYDVDLPAGDGADQGTATNGTKVVHPNINGLSFSNMWQVQLMV